MSQLAQEHETTADAGLPTARTAGNGAVDPDRVVIVSDGSLFGAGLADELEGQWKEAGTQRGRTYPCETLKVQNAGDVIRKMRPAPGVVIFSGTGSDSISLYHELQEEPRLGDLIFAGPATIMSNGFSSGLERGIQGSLYAVTPVPFDDSTPGIIDFQALFQAQYTDPNPTPYSAAAYDATRALIVSVRAAISDGSRPAAVSHGPLVGSLAITLREATLAKLLALNRGVSTPQYRDVQLHRLRRCRLRRERPANHNLPLSRREGGQRAWGNANRLARQPHQLTSKLR